MKYPEYSTVTTFINENGMFVMITITRDGFVMFKREDLTKAGTVPLRKASEVFDINFSFPEGLVIKAKHGEAITPLEKSLVHKHMMLRSDVQNELQNSIPDH